MAKLKTSALLSGIKGSLNGSSIQGNNGSTSLRKKTGRHSEIKRNTFLQLDAITAYPLWLKTLSPAAKKSLIAELKDFQKTDAFGDEYTPTLRNTYIRRFCRYGYYFHWIQIRRIKPRTGYTAALTMAPKIGNPEIVNITYNGGTHPGPSKIGIWLAYSFFPSQKPRPENRIFIGTRLIGAVPNPVDIQIHAPAGWDASKMPCTITACFFDAFTMLGVAETSYTTVY